MTGKEVREKYINFFKSPPRNHKEIDPAPLVLEDDPTTLFTSSGMQPLVPYLMGESHPSGSKRLVNSQPSIRTNDIDEVGDNRHLTFFEMLGNWSLGDYFKNDQLPWVWEFFTKELGLAKDRLWVSVFEGDKQVFKDTESIEIWKKLGISKKRICEYGVEKNWWSRTGTPKQMPVGEIGGPDSEVFYDFGEELKLHEKSEFKDKDCHPNCDCGRFLEIGNSVFIQYRKVGEDKLEELPNKNVDFGGGLERIAAAVNNNPDVYRTDLFWPLIEAIQKATSLPYSGEYKKTMRIIADHIKASCFLITNGVIPSNKTQGYVLRRLIRRAVFKLYHLNKDFKHRLMDISQTVAEIYRETYFIKTQFYKEEEDLWVPIELEADKFMKNLEKGQRYLENVSPFDLYQSYGFPEELIEEIYKERGKVFNKEKFEKELAEHKDRSRTTSAGVFKGGLADHSLEVLKLHTATHLLLASLRKVLGDQVVQKGQNITKERSRFDFPHSEKLSDQKISEVENMINDVVSKNLPVNFKIMPKEDALKTGAIHAFNEKYSDTVKVYFVGSSLESAFSKEFCGGPHVARTGEIGHVRIKKQEKIGANLIRIYLTAENG